MDFAHKDGELEYTREGCHSKPRILFHEDITGQELRRNFWIMSWACPNVTILEQMTLLDFIETKNTCLGVTARDESGEHYAIEAQRTILASGGIGGLYTHSTNYPHLTGDALAIAMRHGVALDISTTYRFIRPRCILKNRGGDSSFPNLCAAKAQNCIMRPGERFANEVLPRDVLTDAIKEQMAKDGKPYVWLDMTVLGREVILRHFPHIYEHCLEEGYDVTKDWIPVVPAQH